MAADSTTGAVRLAGFDDLVAKLRSIAPALRKRVLRNALAAGARVVRDDAKRNAPVLAAGATAPYRTPGTLKRAIKVRTSKRDRRAGDVGVFVNVQPAKRGQAGAKNAADPYYWRWQEFGWTPASNSTTRRSRRLSVKRGEARRIPGKHFLRDSAEKLPAAFDVFRSAVDKWFAKTNVTGRVTP